MTHSIVTLSIIKLSIWTMPSNKKHKTHHTLGVITLGANAIKLFST
jgi:hypothetical protein